MGVPATPGVLKDGRFSTPYCHRYAPGSLRRFGEEFGLVFSEPSDGIGGKMEHALKDPVHDSDYLAEFIGVMV